MLSVSATTASGSRRPNTSQHWRPPRRVSSNRAQAKPSTVKGETARAQPKASTCEWGHQDSYDSRGRLTTVTRGNTVIGAYTYDANDNRITTDDQNGTRTATYDPQDRLLTDGSTSFSYTAEGALLTKKVGNSATHYTYDLFGALRHVTLPDGTEIDYVIDGNHRRIGKKINGTLTSGYLYRNELNIVAELDGNGSLVSQFVYGTQPHVPDFMLRGGKTYRIVSDERGSVRLVVDTTSGAIAQRIDYDAWGNVTNDTNPGFQPFGFAGGIYDRDTGLVRFGARDYDAATGRWSAKDPTTFEGEDSNLYAYAFSDPANIIDPEGEFGVLAAAAAGGLLDAGIDLGIQLATNGGKLECVDWPSVGTSFVIGAAIGGIGRFAQVGGELSFGKNLRVAPFGNRTGHRYGKWPHYHRRPSGSPPPGQGIGRHRPWEPSKHDTGWWDRF